MNQALFVIVAVQEHWFNCLLQSSRRSPCFGDFGIRTGNTKVVKVST